MTEEEANAIASKYGRYHGDADAETPSTVAAVVKAEAPHLTDKQRAALEAAVGQAAGQSTWAGMLRRAYDITVAANPALIAKVPTANELFVAMGWDKLDGQARVEKWRTVEHLGEDDRLAMLPAPAKTDEKTPAKAEEKSTPPAPSPYADDAACDDELARRLSYRDRFELRSKIMASKLRAFRHSLRASATAPTAPTSAATVMAAKGAKDWSEIKDPQTRLRLYRQHVEETGSA